MARLLQQEGVSISRISALIDQSFRKSDLEDFLRSMAPTASAHIPQPTVAAVHPMVTLPLSPSNSSDTCPHPFLANEINTPQASHPSCKSQSCPSTSVKPLRPHNLFSCSTNSEIGGDGDGDGPKDSSSKGISAARRSLEEGLTAESSNITSSSLSDCGLIKVIEQRAAQIEKDVSRF